MDINALIGVRIKELRNEFGIKAEALAVGANISNGFLSKIENGKVNITLAQLQVFADYFKVLVTSLIPSSASINKECSFIQSAETLISNSDLSVKEMFQIILNKLK